MKHDKQKILFILGAFCIITGIIIAKLGDAVIGNGDNNTLFTVVGILMIATGAIFMATNIIIRFIKHSRDNK